LHLTLPLLDFDVGIGETGQILLGKYFFGDLRAYPDIDAASTQLIDAQSNADASR